ncbi:hypothetical protein [Janthinobacterium sp. GW458P]|uniref:hypothetical protein n=1 Tax=Janthinobacterium sp. GW458P TaxID=1981504 RepID=UPI000A32AC38|nr:hypothetical protein [Janthinobacterium sp. GW458P]MBE3025986.1 hypothetical protein [Janthinobacterium sp. GW458P]
MPKNGYAPLLSNILEGMYYNPHIENPDKAKTKQRWQELMGQMINTPPMKPEDSKTFHVRWTESAHKIRELVANDHLLLDMLRIWLPAYIGQDRVLYRGESIERWEDGSVGSGWTPKLETAQMFAGGLNKVGKGGVVLSTTAPRASIIAGPSSHSIYLQEFEHTVDRRNLNLVSEVEFFRTG